MKVDFSKKVYDLFGNPVKMDGKEATLGALTGAAFATNYKDEELSELKTRIRWDQAVDFAKSEVMDISDEVAQEAKTLLNKRWPIGVAGPALTLLVAELEKSAPKKDKKG